MAGTPSTTDHFSTHVEIGGSVTGQLAVGHHITQILAHEGAIVHNFEGLQPPKAREGVLRALPRPFNELVGRSGDLEALWATISSGDSVELTGRDGVGKTAMIRYLAHHSPDDGLNIIFPVGPHADIDDFLDSLFRAFYISPPGYKPAPSEVPAYLSNATSLILVDNAAWTRDELETILDSAPRCFFLFATTTERTVGGRTLLLSGLGVEDSLSVIERRLARSIEGEERGIVAELCNLVDGHPLSLIRIADRLRSEPAEAIAVRMRGARAHAALLLEVVSALSREERDALAVLVAGDGAPLTTEVVARAAPGINVASALPSLEAKGLARSESPYSVRRDDAALLRQILSEGDTAELLFDSLLQWVTQGEVPREEVALQTDAVIRMMDWGTDNDRAEDAIQLGRAAEPALFETGRWGAWRKVVERQADIARDVGDRGALAWSLHQLGSRALCLQDSQEALVNLRAALELREALGDERGAAVTRHNLGLLEPTPPPPRPRWLRWFLLLAAVVAVVGTAVALSGGGPAGRSLRLEPAVASFPRTEVGAQSASQTITILNDGDLPVRVRRVVISGLDRKSFSIVDSSCQRRRLAPEESCELSLTFAPRHIGMNVARLRVSRPNGFRISAALRGRGFRDVTPSADPDLTVQLDATEDPIAVGDTLDVDVHIGNAGGVAPESRLEVGIIGATTEITPPEECTPAGSTFACDLGELNEASQRDLRFSFVPSEPGELTIEAAVSTPDEARPQDNSDSLEIVIQPPEPQSVTLTVVTAFTSRGKPIQCDASCGVVESSQGINCTPFCTATFDDATDVELVAKPGDGFRFAGWSGACVGQSETCRISITADSRTTASFSEVIVE